jgi:hypothetical protein
MLNTGKENTMRNIIFSVLLLPALAWAQDPVIVDKKVVCNSIEIVLSTLTEGYSEQPIWIGEGADSKYSLFTNKQGAWTIIQFNDKIACIIGAGQSSREIFLGPKT